MALVHAFYSLDRDRLNTQNGIGCIPLSSVYQYYDRNSGYIDDQEFFAEVILEVDAAYVQETNARIRSQLQKQKGAARG